MQEKRKSSLPSSDSRSARDPLEIASRCHVNFLENVPLAFMLLVICELNGGVPKYLKYVSPVLIRPNRASEQFVVTLVASVLYLINKLICRTSSCIMAFFFAIRIAHADGGLMREGKFGTNGVGRPIGFFGSLAVLGGLAAYAAWLVKGYWGF